MKKRMKIGTCLVIVLCFLLQPFAGITASAAGSFSDIKEHWAKSYIELLAERGIVNGYKGKFSPDNTLTKAEAATLTCSASGIQPSETVSTSLTDIEGHWGREPPTSKTGGFRSGGNLQFCASVATDALLAR